MLHQVPFKNYKGLLYLRTHLIRLGALEREAPDFLMFEKERLDRYGFVNPLKVLSFPPSKSF